MDFFSTFVRNLNLNKFNWADGRAGRAMNTSTAASPTVVRKPVDPFMKQKKLILLSLTIPILFVLLVLFRQFLEYYFRFSKEYKYIYSYGSTISFFVQLFLVLSSFLLGIYIIANRRRYTFWTNLVSLIFGLSLFLYFTTMLLIGVIKTGV